MDWTRVCLLLVLSSTADAAISVDVNATHINSGDWVKVRWSGIPAADRKGCWIGVFAPASSNVTAFKPRGKSTWTQPYTETAPLKFVTCDHKNKHFPKTGNGEYQFTLLNMRTDVTFWLFTNGMVNPKPQARTATITFSKPNQPMHVHLARTHTAHNMRVSWVSGHPLGAVVQWWQGSNPTPKTTVQADSRTYTAQDLCGPPANANGFFSPGWLHTAEIVAVKNDTLVSYRVGSTSSGEWSETFQFLPAAPEHPHTPLKVLVVGDVGATEMDGCSYHWAEPDAWQTFAFMYKRAHSHHLALHVGDLSYATGYEAKWELFMHSVAGVAQYVPYMTGLGNHERDWPGTGNAIGGVDSGGECGVPTEQRFTMPTKNHVQGNGWYSFNQASVHFVMLNTEMAVHNGSDQYLWLEADLKKVDRSLTPWLVVNGHRPMYNGMALSPHFLPLEYLLNKYKVDLVLWAHVHYAFASCPMYRGKCKTKAADGYDAPVHAIIGNGGQGLSPPQFTAPWVKYGGAYWGANEIIVDSAEHMKLNFYVDATEKLNYTVHITRPWPRKY